MTIRRGLVDLFDLWHRAGVKAAALTHLAEADAFRPSLGLARREALCAIKALRDEPLPLFAVAQATREAEEPDALLQPMRDGAEVVRDYNRLGLTLRDHLLIFLREDLQARHIMSCRQALAAKDGKRLTVAGLVLVR